MPNYVFAQKFISRLHGNYYKLINKKALLVTFVFLVTQLTSRQYTSSQLIFLVDLIKQVNFVNHLFSVDVDSHLCFLGDLRLYKGCSFKASKYLKEKKCDSKHFFPVPFHQVTCLVRTNPLALSTKVLCNVLCNAYHSVLNRISTICADV